EVDNAADTRRGRDRRIGGTCPRVLLGAGELPLCQRGRQALPKAGGGNPTAALPNGRKDRHLKEQQRTGPASHADGVEHHCARSLQTKGREMSHTAIVESSQISEIMLELA